MFKGLRTKSPNVWSQEKMKCHFQKQVELPFFGLFVLPGPGWHQPTLGGWSLLRHLLVQVLIFSGDTLRDTPRYKGHPWAQSSGHTKLTSTHGLLKVYYLAAEYLGIFQKSFCYLFLLFSENITCMTWILLNIMKLDWRPRICLFW